MLIAYGDESSDGKRKRVYVVAVVFGTQGQWGALTTRWLERTGGVVFHATECEGGHGHYASNTPAENTSLYSDLVDILVESDLRGFGHGIDLYNQSQHMSMKFSEQDYHLGLREVLITVAREVHVVDKPARRVRFILDRKPEIKGAAECIYDYFVSTPEWLYNPALHETLDFSSRKEVGIQAADLWTRELMKSADDHIETDGANQRSYFKRFADSQRFGCRVIMKDYFRGWAAALGKVEKEVLSEYDEWRQRKNVKADNICERFRYQRSLDAEARRRGDVAYFDEHRGGLYR